MENAKQSTPQTSTASLIVFWAYVLIPLAWGVVKTLKQAVKLFG